MSSKNSTESSYVTPQTQTAPDYQRKFDTPYEVIDTDPHFFRVIRYFRKEDYLAFGIGTAAFPGILYYMEKAMPQRRTLPLKGNLILSTCLGACGGFLYAYQSSSMRFWGWKENTRETAKDLKEMRQRVRDGKPLYGESALDNFSQQAAALNSRYSALKFAAIPWFNFVNHPFHGVDTSKYYQNDDE